MGNMVKQMTTKTKRTAIATIAGIVVAAVITVVAIRGGKAKQ
jgi:hypothetical protein